MRSSDGNSAELSQDIHLRELFHVFWSGKVFIALITVAFAGASVFYSLSLPNQYRATAILAPASGGISETLGQLGPLASFAGISIGNTSATSDTQLAKEIMQSWSFIEKFVYANDLTPMLFAAAHWDEGSGKVNFRQDLYSTDSGEWSPSFKQPSGWEVYESFSGKLTVEEDKRSGLTSVSIEYISPNIAKAWVDLYVSEINRHMQTRKINMIEKNIQYLEDQIASTPIPELREVFFTIISEQVKARMMAEATPDYVFVPVSPSMVPERKSQPNRALICVIGTFAGFVFANFVVLITYFVFDGKRLI